MLTSQKILHFYYLHHLKFITVRTIFSSTRDLVEYKRIAVQEADSVRELLTSEGFKPRKSPYIYYIPKVTLPEQFIQYTQRVLQHENIPNLEEGAEKLTSHLRYRQPPIEEDEYRSKVSRIEDEIKAKDSFLEPFLSEEQLKNLEEARHNKVRKELTRTIYHWKPIRYDHTTALHYLISRAAAEYAAVSRVFQEIVKRDPTFSPSSMLDFGSGVGSVLWAAKHFWSSSLIENMCVDSSREMNDIAELIIRKGIASRAPIFPGTYFRQFLPVGAARKYDLTVSSFSLMELPSAQARMEILDNLWKRTRKYLVLLEPGSNAGFELINEARDFILQTYSKDQKGEQRVNTDIPKIREGHVFSPCPNDSVCPRYATDNTPCNFNVRYRPLLPFERDMTATEVFCYVVLRKGPRKGTDEQWPRLVRDPLLRGKHVICRLCTKNGDLTEAILTKKKHIRPLYACAKKSQCGDILPVVEVEHEPLDESENGDDILEEEESSESEEDNDGQENRKGRGRYKERKRYD